MHNTAKEAIASLEKKLADLTAEHTALSEVSYKDKETLVNLTKDYHAAQDSISSLEKKLNDLTV